MKRYRWRFREVQKPDVIARLQNELNNLPEALARALSLRGVENLDEARLFFRPSLADLYDPFLMQDMDVAADRLAQAIRTGERVLVYGDYDVDGTTATALLLSFLRSRGVNASYYIPDRFGDGYGLGQTGIDYAASLGATLIVALDCGITGHDAARYTRSLGIDLVICDHHTVGDTIPEAVAVLDPKRPDCCYPFKELTGCGVGFKLVQAVMARLDMLPEQALDYLDLVSLSIAGDIVPILGENRVMMIEGLRRIKEHPRMGLRKLAEESNLDLNQCSTSQIIFGLGPRINAAGRLGDARRAVDLLIETNEGRATRLARKLEEVNVERRTLDNDTLEQALEMAEHAFATPTNKALVLHRADWHLGVIGIVASRLVDRYYRPTILLCTINGEIKGSARSINGFNIYDALKACRPLLTRFGGHNHAAGMTLPKVNLEAFREQFNAVTQKTISSDILLPEILIDASLDLPEITPRFWSVLRQFAPFGPENKNPVFMSHSLRVVGNPTIVGKGGHLKFRVSDSEANGTRVFDAIGFGLHEHWPTLRTSQSSGQPFQMLYSVDKNTWNGKTTLQLLARDIRLARTDRHR